MNKMERAQIAFVLKVTQRYKENGGFIYKHIGNGTARVRCSLADFILAEVGALSPAPNATEAE